MVIAGRLTPRDQATAACGSKFADLIDALRAVDVATASPDAVEAILRGAALDDAALEPYVWFAAGRYARNCVYRDARFEVLVLCWDTPAASAIHDHGASRCFFALQRGALRVDDYTLAAGGRVPGPARLEHRRTRIMQPGEIDARTVVGDVHRVAPVGGPAISVHVYAEPLDTCLVFDVEQNTCRSAVNRYDRSPIGMPAAR